MILPSVITIDPAKAKDLDDAVNVTETPDGEYITDICIADVARHIKPNTEHDLKARRLGFSTYMNADILTPMLPFSLTMRLSLLPNKRRAMVWIQITLDAKMNVTNVQLKRILHQTEARLSYPEADAAMHNPAHPFYQRLRCMNTLATKLRTKHKRVWDDENNLITNEEGETEHLREEERYASHLIIHELMILANSTLADLAQQQGKAILFRNHCRKRGNISTEEQQAMDEDVRFCNRLMGRAYLTTQLEGHYGLKRNAYAHFTSPIRRYADIINLRALFGEELPEDLDALAEQQTLLAAQEKEQHSEQFRKWKVYPLISYIRTKGTTSLHTTKFRLVIEACLISGITPKDLGKSLDMRLLEGSLHPRDFIIIFHQGRPLFGTESVMKVWAFLWANPTTFLQAAEIAQHQGIIPGVPKNAIPSREERMQHLETQLCEALILPPAQEVAAYAAAYA